MTEDHFLLIAGLVYINQAVHYRIPLVLKQPLAIILNRIPEPVKAALRRVNFCYASVGSLYLLAYYASFAHGGTSPFQMGSVEVLVA